MFGGRVVRGAPKGLVRRQARGWEHGIDTGPLFTVLCQEKLISTQAAQGASSESPSSRKSTSLLTPRGDPSPQKVLHWQNRPPHSYSSLEHTSQLLLLCHRNLSLSADTQALLSWHVGSSLGTRTSEFLLCFMATVVYTHRDLVNAC